MTGDGVSREPSNGEDRKILCVGRAEELVSLRAMVLRGAGFQVIEERDVTRAVQLALEESIGLVLLCHTLNSLEQSRILYALNSTRQHLLIACVVASDHYTAPEGARAVPREPQRLIEAIQNIFEESRWSEATSIGED